MSFLLLRKIYYGILGLGFPIVYPLIYNNLGSSSKFGLEGNYILLSFDIDYKRDIDSIPALLKILHKLSIKASFAVIGMHVEKYPGVFEKILLEGHEILNHTYSHPNNDELSPNRKYKELPDREKEYEIGKCQNIINNTLGYYPKGFRLPHFGNVQTINFSWLFTVLNKLNFKYDTSVLFPNYKKAYKSFFEKSSIIELPVTTCPRHPFTALDTYHIYRSKRYIYKAFHGCVEWSSLLSKAKQVSDKNNLPLNVYVDPHDILQNKDNFFNAITILNSTGVKIATYSDYISSLEKIIR